MLFKIGAITTLTAAYALGINACFDKTTYVKLPIRVLSALTLTGLMIMIVGMLIQY